MKFLAVLALVSVAFAAPLTTEMSLDQIVAAIDNPSTDPALIPALTDALNEVMDALWAGNQAVCFYFIYLNKDLFHQTCTCYSTSIWMRLITTNHSYWSK